MSSADERSPKRRRRSYSPASPPLDTKRPAGETPQTPPPSVRMSPSVPSQTLPGLGLHGTTFPTPPSTAGFQSQMMARGASGDGGATGSAHNTPSEEVDNTQAASDAETKDHAQNSGDVAMAEADSEHRRTDHERQEPPASATKVLYKISPDPIPPSQPHPAQNLLQLYGLARIQSSVARRDAATGEKINKLRKSYEGKVRDLGLEGRNKATPKEGILEGLVHPDWDLDVGGGETNFHNRMGDYMLGEHDVDELMGKLGKAFDLKPGRVPGKEGAEWRDMLGLDQAAATAANPKIHATASSSTTAPFSAKPTTANLLAKTAPATAATPIRNSAPASPRGLGARPERAGKKRRYDESSYAGYQEGYEDDGYSTGGIDEAGRRGSASKRQKRKDFSPTFSTAPNGSGSMVGVKSS